MRVHGRAEGAQALSLTRSLGQGMRKTSSASANRARFPTRPQCVAQRLSALLTGGEALDWVPDKPVRSLEGACSPYVEEMVLYLKVSVDLIWGGGGGEWVQEDGGLGT